VIAGHTRLPVIGRPLSGGIVTGLDALLSTVQMPPGIPVASVAVDGTKNAALLAARILALNYPEIDKALEKAASCLKPSSSTGTEPSPTLSGMATTLLSTRRSMNSAWGGIRETLIYSIVSAGILEM
jgi:hypothetical protein